MACCLAAGRRREHLAGLFLVVEVERNRWGERRNREPAATPDAAARAGRPVRRRLA